MFTLKGESVFLIGFWFWAKGNFQVLGFGYFFLAEIFGFFFFFLIMPGFRKVFFFFNIVLTWKIVGVSKVSVLYI